MRGFEFGLSVLGFRGSGCGLGVWRFGVSGVGFRGSGFSMFELRGSGV